MNSVNIPTVTDDLTKFRCVQQELIERSIAEYGLKYLRSIGVPIQSYSINVVDRAEYTTCVGSALREVTIKVNNMTFMTYLVPKLLHDYMYIINGTKYVPKIYLDSVPIVIKKRSIKLFSLFQPITIYYTDKRVTFMGTNIPMHYFFHAVFDELPDISFQFGSQPADLVSYWVNMLGCEPDLDVIRTTLNKLFFDEYTRTLYKKVYDLPDDFTLADIVARALKERSDVPEFADLSFKRLVLAEMIMQSVIKKFGQMAYRWCKQQLRLEPVQMTQLIVLKQFFDNGGDYLYDIVNGFVPILGRKATFDHPTFERLPPSVHSLDKSHYKRVCPITVSSVEPGIVVSLIHDIKLKDYVYGLLA